jgi:TldD protein
VRGLGRIAARRLVQSALALCAAVGLAAAAEPESDTTMAALAAELSRSMELHVQTLERPYFIAYRLGDIQSFDVEASLGAIVSAPEVTRTRWFRPEVRVGSWQLDSKGGDLARPAVLDDAELRHDLWLATDEAYKSAVGQLAQKRAMLKNRVEAEPAADFTPEAPVTALLAPRATTLDPAKWREVVRRLSAVFRDFPAIHESGVRLQVTAGRKYIVTSEGTRLRLPAGLTLLFIRAATQASDGGSVGYSALFGSRRLEDLPPEAELSAAARRVAEKATALATAPTLESYTGPVLFAGQASAELFAQVLLPQVSDHRPPIEIEQGPKNDLSDKLGRPVLPAFLSVVDDPRQEAFAGRPLFGSYAFDDEGMPAAAVTLVEKGELKTLLMSRRPRKEIDHANGHGRGQIQGTIGASAANFFVKAADGQAVTDPKAELIRLCREEGLKFGILVRVLAPGSGRPGRSALGAPIEAYRVFVEDGHEELVRGLVPGEVTVRTLKDIVAAGNDTYVCDRLVAAGGASIIAPSVIVKEMEFSREPGSRQKLPLLESPLAAAKRAAR